MDMEKAKELLSEASKLLWSHNGAGQGKAWELSNQIDRFLGEREPYETTGAFF